MFRAQKGKSWKWQSSTSAEHIFMAPMDREACIELPQEDKLPEGGDAVGLLLRSMYVFRTASANWQRLWRATLEPRAFLQCRRGVVAEFTVTTLPWAHAEHWTGWARPYLATPCEKRTVLALGTVNATLSC